MNTTWTSERARLAALLRHKSPDAPEIEEARRDLRAARLEKIVRETVAAAPPLTDEQRRRLAVLLLGGDAE